jgi:hypothetical protein
VARFCQRHAKRVTGFFGNDFRGRPMSEAHPKDHHPVLFSKCKKALSTSNATGYRLGTGILAFLFLCHPAPTASYFRPLSQTGTLLATGVRFSTENAVISAR